MPIIFLKVIADLYGCGALDLPFIDAVNLTTSEGVSSRKTAVVLFFWPTTELSSSICSYIDQYNVAATVLVAHYLAHKAIRTNNTSDLMIGPVNLLLPVKLKGELKSPIVEKIRKSTVLATPKIYKLSQKAKTSFPLGGLCRKIWAAPLIFWTV